MRVRVRVRVIGEGEGEGVRVRVWVWARARARARGEGARDMHACTYVHAAVCPPSCWPLRGWRGGCPYPVPCTLGTQGTGGRRSGCHRRRQRRPVPCTPPRLCTLSPPHPRAGRAPAPCPLHPPHPRAGRDHAAPPPGPRGRIKRPPSQGQARQRTRGGAAPCTLHWAPRGRPGRWAPGYRGQARPGRRGGTTAALC